MSVELIAECSTNHGGDMSLAKEFIQRFAEAGADFVKFQLTRVAHLRKDDPQREWFARAEFSEDQFAELKAATEAAGAKFLLTVYHAADAPILKRLGMTAVKIGSGESSDVALHAALFPPDRTRLDPIFSRVFVALGLAHQLPSLSAYSESFPVEFMGCIARYPAPPSLAANILLGSRTTKRGQVVTGWSDHAVGLEECYAAICCGARIIEKHVHLIGQARMVQPWEASTGDFKRLRQFADDNPAERFLGRWQHA